MNAKLTQSARSLLELAARSRDGNPWPLIGIRQRAGGAKSRMFDKLKADGLFDKANRITQAGRVALAHPAVAILAEAMEAAPAIAAGEHRYWLSRHVPDLWVDHAYGRTLFVMLNPSTADATTDDATVRKCLGFTKRFGATGHGIVNLFTRRATNPANLPGLVDLNGADADLTIRAAILWLSAKGWPNQTSRLIFAYGAPPWADADLGRHTPGARMLRLQGERIAFVRQVAEAAGFKPWALGLTAKGWPRHPSRLPYGDGDNPAEGFASNIGLVPSAHFERFAPAIRPPEEG